MAPPRPRVVTLAGVVALALALAGFPACGSDPPQLFIYAGRNENLVRPLLDRFAKEVPGVDVRVRYADTPEALATILEEGKDNTRADVFLSQDAGALAHLGAEGFFADLPADLLDLVGGTYRDPGGRWVGVTGRARVIAHSTERVPATELPASVLEVATAKWKGRVGFPPSNASFIAFVSALRHQVGEERARQFLEGLRDNEAKRFDNNVLVLEAITSGEIDLGLVNHYYLYSEFEERPGAPIDNYFPGQGDGGEGTFVNVSGVGVLSTSRGEERQAAIEFVRFLLSEESQTYFRDETAEYPLRLGVDAIPELPPLASIRTIDVPLVDLGGDLESTVELIKDVGLT